MTSISPKVIELQNIVYKIASNIFNGITPPEKYSTVSQNDVQYSLDNLVAVINPDSAYNYLTKGDGFYVRRLTTAIDSGMRDVLKDNQITLADAPVILKMVKDVSIAVNNIEKKKDVLIEISKHSLIPLVQTIVCLVCQMFLTQGQYEILHTLVVMSFELIGTNIDPILITKKFKSCFGKKNT